MMPVQGNQPGLPDSSEPAPAVLEPVAIVGFSIKFPGDADSSESFWKLMSDKRCASSRFPKDRVNIDAFYHPDSTQLDTVPVHNAHFLKEDLGAFDAHFFSITPSEALSMDPQQRGLLETSYRALENAGIPLHKIDGTPVGVFTGSFGDDYRISTLKDVACMPKHAAIGLGQNFTANRLSWAFNLKGPSIQIDTACSSSLIALDMACQSLRSRDSSMALVCGSNVISSIESFMTLSNMGFLSPDGKCFSFDARGNGYGRGEGFGVLVVKLLSDAIRDGDTIRAVVQSSGTNQNGRNRSITQTSKSDQISLMIETYRKAGLDLAATRFVEAHGTGTALGDPVEAGAIGQVFGQYRSAEDPLYIGAVKSNVGHLEGASGIAGIVKAVLALEKGVIPPNTNFERLNPKIKAKALNLEFPATSVPWPTTGLRRASINSFGFGGSNAHVVIDDAYHYMAQHGLHGNHCTAEVPPSREANGIINPDASVNGELVNGTPLTNGDSHAETNGYTNGVDSHHRLHRPRILPFSAMNEASCKNLTAAYTEYYQDPTFLKKLSQDASYLDDLSYTLTDRRTHLPCRSYAILQEASELSALGTLVTKVTRSTSKLGLCFVFTGQGAQYAGMGKELLEYPAFKKILLRAESILQGLGCQWSVIDELLRDDATTRINEPEFSQPLCTVLQIALVELLRTCGVRPSIVVGHSSGEIAAAYAAGGLSLVSACKAAYFRGKYSSMLATSGSRRGAMLAAGLSQQDAEAYINKIKGESSIGVACINSPTSVTISGDESAIDKLKETLDAESLFNRKLKVNVAYHSSHMEEIAPHYSDSLHHLETGDASEYQAIMVSSVTGEPVSATELSDKEYWVRNLVSPVRFSEALTHICSKSSTSSKRGSGLPAVHHLLELGPHSTLQGPIRDTVAKLPKAKDITYFSALRRGDSAINTILKAAGELWSQGYEVDFLHLNTEHSCSSSLRTLTDLPQYPFDHSNSYFHLPRYQKDFLQREFPRLELLGSPVLGFNPLEPSWRNIIRASELPWVEDHVVNGTILYPAAGMIVMGLEAARLMAPADRKLTGFMVKEATFSHSLAIPTDDKGVETRLHLKPLGSNADRRPELFEFSLLSLASEQWIRNCQGVIALEFETDDVVQPGAIRSQYCPDITPAPSIAKDEIYEEFAKLGLEYGPSFQALSSSFYSEENIAYAEVDVFPYDEDDGEAVKHEDHVIHPVTLDALAQVAIIGLTEGGVVTTPTNVPTAIRDLWISAEGLSRSKRSALKAYSETVFRSDHQNEFSITAVDTESGEMLVSLSRLETTNVGGVGKTTEDVREQQQTYLMETKPDIDFLDPTTARKYFTSLLTEVDMDDVPDLDLYMIGTFRQVSRQIDPSQIDESRPHHRKYVDWMHRRVKQFEATAPEDQLRLTDDPALLEDLQSKIATAGYAGKFYSEVGRNLLGILQGTVDPLAILFEGTLARNLYQEVNTRISAPLTRLMDLLTHKNPNMKILEVGAGTGGTSEVVLNALQYEQRNGEPGSLFTAFDYTDISASFFESAKELFKIHEQKMGFRVLDIEQEPAEQGFENGTYDLVLAANVLHATRCLETTLRNTRRLLKPGGKLVLIEVTNSFHRSGFGMGLLPGWWLGSEEFRVDGPCVTTERWDDVLKKTGFGGMDFSIEDRDFSGHHDEMSIIVATAVEEEEAAATKSLGEVYILCDDDSTEECVVGREIESVLREQGRRCTLTSMNNPVPENASKAFLIVLLEIDRPKLNSLDEEKFSKLQAMLIRFGGVLWVNSGDGRGKQEPEFRMIDGLRRVLATEHPDRRFVTLSLGNTPEGSADYTDSANLILKIYEKMVSSPMDEFEEEYIRDSSGLVKITRMREAQELNRYLDEQSLAPKVKECVFGEGPALKMEFETPGVIDSLRFVGDEGRDGELGDGEVEVEVRAAGLIFRDCLIALGRMKADSKSIGAEFSGVVRSVGANCDYNVGNRVYGFTTTGCFGSLARTRTELVSRIPEHLGFVETAGVPIAFGTVVHALESVARLEEGESVLVHSAAGGTGQAAVQIARLIGATVYATVGTEHKKKLLMERYGIPESHIFSSRTTRFAQQIKALTHGKGVDVVLNSLSGDKLTASWECIAAFGRFVEIGKRDIMGNSKLDMLPFLRNVSFCTVDLFGMIVERPGKVKRILERVTGLLGRGEIGFGDRGMVKVFGVGEMEGAFREMVGGASVGKIVVEMRDEDVVKALLPPPPPVTFDPSASYLLAGGFGGVARSLARWMSANGARNLILLSRSGIRPNHPSESLVQELSALGVRIEAPKCDVSDLEQLTKVVEQCKEKGMPDIKGCIQGSMVLRDGFFADMEFEDWKDVLAPRVRGTINLHRALPKGMDFFIMLSSIAGVAGTACQANYAAANTFLDAFARYRVGLGERATSLDVGWVEDVGTIAENEQLQRFWKGLGWGIPVNEKEIFGMVGYHCRTSARGEEDGKGDGGDGGKEEEMDMRSCQAVIGIGSPDLVRRNGVDELPTFLCRPMFRFLYHIRKSGSSSSPSPTTDSSTDPALDFPSLFSTALSSTPPNPSLAKEVLLQALIHRIAKAISVPAENVDPGRPLHAYGVDSLLGLELRNWFRRGFGVEVSVFEILGAGDFGEVVGRGVNSRV